MWKRLKKAIYITEPRFGIDDYRRPIVWVDKLILTAGILAAIAGRILCLLWAVSFCLERETLFESPAFVASGVLLWAVGEYFSRTGHRGLIYHHMDLLADYLDRRTAAELTRKQRNDPVEG